ncbi:MAG: hypothetical protein QG646_2938 [Euryarchaeota archaeon]|nr:hypothetical protein [Euryarchaeota archaeon]
MVDKSSDSLLNNLKKKNNPFKKIFENVKKLVKKDDEKGRNPSSVEAPKKGKKENVKKSPTLEPSKKGRRGKGKRSSVKESKNEKSSEINRQLEDSGIPKIETPETKEAEKSMKENRGKIKEQKLPTKYKKGW